MKTIRHTIYSSVAVLILLLLLSSCIRENYATDEQGIIVLSVDGATTRAGDLFTGDAQIEKVRIIVYINDYMEKNVVFTSGSADFVNPFQLEVATGTKTVYVVANETSGLTTQLNANPTKTALEAMLADEINGALTPPVVMVGKTTDVSVVANATNTTTVTLTRVAAKISLKFKKDTESEVKITKISLIDNTKKTPLFVGGATITGQGYWDYSFSPASQMTLNATLTAVTGAESVYVYENLTGGDKTNATQLEVEALFNSIPTIYRVYINENVSTVVNSGDPESSETNPDDHLYSIKRNYEYQLNGTIGNIGESDGLTLTTNVLPWNVLASAVSYKYTYTINPYPEEANKEYTVTGTSSETSFTFQLTDPINGEWMAQLTNPTEFELSGTISGSTGGAVATIKIKPKQNQDLTERTTEFYITINGVEIPLLSGSSLTGIGNRIVITQPSL